jgi:hypothetical protein
MRKTGFLALILTMGLASSAFGQTKAFVLEFGNSWGNLTTPGSSHDVVGRITKTTGSAAPIAFDMTTSYEYTFHMTGMTLDAAVFNAGATDSFYFGAGGTIGIYEHSPKNSARPPAASPPNGTVPGTFTDGTLILSGSVDNLLLTRRDGASSSPDSVGEARGEVTFNGGTRLGELTSNCNGNALGWFFNVALSADWTTSFIPVGYNFYWAGELLKNTCPPTSTEPSTWGSIKGLYR